jgi:integrase
MAYLYERPKKDGSIAYYARVVTGYKPDGTPLQESRTYASKKERATAVKAWETEIARGMTGGNAKMILADYLDEWLARKARSAQPITVAGYRWLIGHTMTGTALARTQLGRLTPALVQRWIDDIPHAATAKKARAVLNIALNEATRLGHIAINPVARTTPPAHAPHEGAAWTAEETRRFLAVADTDIYAPFWHIALYLGMRPSEIAGLKWESIDFAAGTLKVERARPTFNGQTFDSERTKSEAGRRTYALPAPLADRLRAHRTYQKELRLAMGPRWRESGLVCTTQVGTPLYACDTGIRFHKLIARAGVPHIRPYDLRHTATSLMIDAGADIKAASEALGHSDPRITMKVYRHVRGDQRAQAINLLAGAITVQEAAEEDTEEAN